MVSAKNKCIESLVILANVSYTLPRGYFLCFLRGSIVRTRVYPLLVFKIIRAETSLTALKCGG